MPDDPQTIAEKLQRNEREIRFRRWQLEHAGLPSDAEVAAGLVELTRQLRDASQRLQALRLKYLGDLPPEEPPETPG